LLLRIFKTILKLKSLKFISIQFANAQTRVVIENVYNIELN